MTPARRVFLGLGSNLGDRLGYLREAIASIGDVVGVSPVYETDPVGGPGGQQMYMNVVVELSTTASADELLDLAKRLETQAERVRTVKDGPRTLDVDVLLVGDESVSRPDLEIPHPRMWERRFVLAPLRDLAPDLVGPEVLSKSEGQVRLVGGLGVS